MCLSTLGLVEPDWYDTWLERYAEYKGEYNPDVEAKRLKLAQQKTDQKKKEEETEKDADKDLDKDFIDNVAYSKGLADFLSLCNSLTERRQTPLRKALREEYDKVWKKKPWTKAKLDKLEARTKKYQREVVTPMKDIDARGKEKAKAKKEGKERLKKDNREAKREAIQGMRDLRDDCTRQNQWRAAQHDIDYANRRRASVPKSRDPKSRGRIWMDPAEGQAKNMIRAITRLREVTKSVCSKLTTRINAPGSYSTPELEYDLESFTIEARPWIEEFKKATRDPFDKVIDHISEGGSVAKEKPPTKPRSIGFMDRSVEDYQGG